MPFKETKEGQTHYFNDGCGIPEHNDTAHMPSPQPIPIENKTPELSSLTIKEDE